VLRHIGARFLAGYDYMGQFPFLDIALEWDGDRTLHRKRSHVVDDLLQQLEEAIGGASVTDRRILAVAPPPLPRTKLPRAQHQLFHAPVVAIHAGPGNATEQWPPEYFIALIERPLERDGVNVLLVGGPDETELSGSIIAGMPHADRIASVVGKLPLADMPAMLALCRLYIGNDSGPKHIAAAVGIPTIGIHSGVVDTGEWGLVGRRAVALQRSMIYSRLYLANAEDCPRELAYLTEMEPAVVHQMAQPAGPAAVRTVHELAAAPPFPAKAKPTATPKARRRSRVHA